MKVREIYVAEDGREFEDKQACLNYEASFSVNDYNRKVETVCALLNTLGVKAEWSAATDEDYASLAIYDYIHKERYELHLPSEDEMEMGDFAFFSVKNCSTIKVD